MEGKRKLQKEKQTKKVLRNVLLAFVLMLIVTAGVKLDAKAAKYVLSEDDIVKPDDLDGYDEIWLDGHKLTVNGDFTTTACIYLSGGTLEVNGNMTASNSINLGNGTLKVEKNYTQIDMNIVGYSAKISIGKHFIFPKNTKEGHGGALELHDSSSTIEVKGNLIYKSTRSSGMAGGIYTVYGDFIRSIDAGGFGGNVEPKRKIAYIFDDVNDSDWFKPAVKDVYDKKLMVGVSDTYFGAANQITRGQMVTILHRVEGEPNVEFKEIFSDVKEQDYFANAVMWANKNGIAVGISKNKFDPNSPLTREMMVTMLYRYVTDYKGVKVKTNKKALDGFVDKATVSSYALDAMRWAVYNGIINGKNKNLDPKGKATRAEVAQVLMNFNEKYNIVK